VEVSTHMLDGSRDAAFVGYTAFNPAKAKEESDALSAKSRRFVRSEKKEAALSKKSNDHIVNGS
jgi:hypothetical protein